MKRVITRNVDISLLLSLPEARHAVSQTRDICLPILDTKKWWITISVGWIIRIFFKLKKGLCPIQIGSEDHPTSYSKVTRDSFTVVNVNRCLMTYLCSDLGLYRTDFWSLLCLYGIVLRRATLHHLIPMSYDISSWESFVLLIAADLGCPSADTAQEV
jgi:hypothetical protein